VSIRGFPFLVAAPPRYAFAAVRDSSFRRSLPTCKGKEDKNNSLNMNLRQTWKSRSK
jgi:hypothetical protein